MKPEEDQLRGALHRLNAGDPEPLDADQIIAGARARQTRNRARIAGATAALAVVALAGALLPQALRGPMSGVSSGSAPEAKAPAPAASSGAAAPQRGGSAGPQASGSAGQPGPAEMPPASISAGQWCLADATPACHPLGQDRAEVEVSGTPMLAVLAPAGTERIETVRPGDPAPKVRRARGEQDRLIGLQPLAGAVPIRAVAADGRVLATW